MSIKREDYSHFRFTIKTQLQQSFVSALANTGCQSCLAGPKIVKKLGLSTKDFIPVALKMHAAHNHDIRILGATTIRLSGTNNKGERTSTRQMVYVTSNTDKLFLSRKACTDFGIISKNSKPLTALRKTPSCVRLSRLNHKIVNIPNGHNHLLSPMSCYTLQLQPIGTNLNNIYSIATSPAPSMSANIKHFPSWKAHRWG